MTLMMSIAIVVFGVVGLTRLPVRELPDVDAVVVNVLTVYPGASAEVVETEVTEKLEEAIASAESIRILRSESREQVSSIEIEFSIERDVDLAAQDVRDAVARVRGRLPVDIEDPIVSKQDASARPIMWVAFYSDRFTTQELTEIAETRVKDLLQTVPGVSSVIIGGEKRFAVRIWLDSAQMAAREVTVLDVERALREQNVELPSGRVESVDREFTIQTLAAFNAVEQFQDLVIRQDGANMVRLIDIGRVEPGVEDERSIARYNSRPAIGLGIVRQSKSNVVAVADGVKAEMERIMPSLPEGIEMRFPYDESLFVRKSLKEVFETLLIAFALVVGVIFLFLRNIRPTIIPSISIPVSIIGTFLVLYLLGFSINTFTLLALVLAIGIVVDDAIVVLENIYRHIEDGKTPLEAAIQSMREIGFAIITITLSLVAVFLPIAFLGGTVGRLLVEFAVALTTAVVISAFVALTLSPMVSSRILKSKSQVKHGRVFLFFEKVLDNITDSYQKTLRWALGHRVAVLAVAAGSLVLAGYFLSQLDQDFLPEEDKGRLLSIAVTPEGSTPEYTDRMARQMEEIVQGFREVEGYFTAVALPFNGPGNASQAFMFMRLVEGERRRVQDIVQGPFGLGAQFFFNVEGAFSFPLIPKAVDTGFAQPFQLVLSHPDLDQLNQATQAVAGELRQAGFLVPNTVRSSFELTKPELRVSINRDRASTLNVSIADISRTLQVLFGGVEVSTFKRGGREYEVIAQLDRERRMTPSDLERVTVRNSEGVLIQLSNLVTVNEAAGPNAIERFQRLRSATIEGTPAGVPLGTAVEQAEVLLAEMDLPDQMVYDWKGEARDLRETTANFLFFFLLASVVVYMVLAAQFESFAHPFTIMLALPLAAVGAFGLLYALSWVNWLGEGMYAMNNYMPDPPVFAAFLDGLVPRIPAMNINVFSLVGLVLLIGLVTKNSILLVEFANQRVRSGLNPDEAMMQAGLIRLRPILMTSLATIAGILPIALGLGDAAQSRRPLGVVAVGGMVTSTLLTLFVIPVVYTLISKVGAGKKKTVEKLQPQPDLENETAQAGER